MLVSVFLATVMMVLAESVRIISVVVHVSQDVTMKTNSSSVKAMSAETVTKNVREDALAR